MFSKKSLLFSILSIFSFILIPVMIFTILLYSMATSEEFYLSLIRQLSPVETFIEAKNSMTEKDVLRQVEKKTGLSSFRPEFEKIETTYKDRLAAYNRINRTEEYNRLDKQIDELDDMDWEEAPDTFRDEKSFEKFKKTRLSELKNKIDEIKKYRDKNDDAIDESEDVMDDAKDSFEDAREKLQDKEEQARDIVRSRREELSNSLITDMAEIEPEITEKLNYLFLDREIRRVIGSYIDFFSEYEKQKASGMVFTRRLDIKSGRIENTRIVKIPALSISLYTDFEEKGKTRRRHIFSEIIPSVIDSVPNLSNPWLLKKIFTLSDSWIAEAAGRSVIEKYGLTIKNGRISSEEIVMRGKKAQMAEYLMIAASYGKYSLYLFPALIFILIASLLFTGKTGKEGMRRIGIILKYSSAASAVIFITGIIISMKPLMLLPHMKILDNVMIKEITERIIFTSGLYFLIPAVALFLIISAAGSYILKKSGCQ